MGKFDFETVLDRLGHDAVALDYPCCERGFFPEGPKNGYSLIPMSFADMNFITAPSVVESIQGRLNHHSFGYFSPRKEYYDAIINWQKVRYGVDVSKDAIGYENGVMGALATFLNSFMEEGEPLLIHGPTYIGFQDVIKTCGHPMSISPLVEDENGILRMDFEDMEKRIVDENLKIAVLCSPHNPAGRVWEKWEVEKFMELMKKYDLKVFSDEIWCDLILNGAPHIPTNSVSEDAKMRTVAAYAPSKTFSLSGMVASYHVIYNEDLKKKMAETASKSHYNSMNIFSQYALIGAYNEEGQQWVDELLPVLAHNMEFVCDYIRTNYPSIKFHQSQGTYMLYLDLGDFVAEKKITIKDALRYGWERGVMWQNGEPFGTPNSIRLNLALPTWQIEEAIKRLNTKLD